jgi:U3 small nucleolar RNA-associated protein 18
LRKLRKHPDEDEIHQSEYAKRLRTQFVKLNPTPSWATLGGSGGELDADDPLNTTNSLLDNYGGDRLLPGVLEVGRMKDANHVDPSHAVIQSVRFHPSSQVLLTGGFDKTLRLFQVDGKKNPKLQSVFIPDLPIYSAEFTADGSEVILSGRRPFFYTYDLGAGKIQKIPRIFGKQEKSWEKFVVSPDGQHVAFHGMNGYMVIVSQKTKQWVCDLKMNSAVQSASFSPDGMSLFSSGKDGEVHIWDLRMRRCLDRHMDHGTCKGSTAIGVSNNYYATGSHSGVVNIYERKNRCDGLAQTSPHLTSPHLISLLLSGEAEGPGREGRVAKPVKELMHLTTACDSIRFNHDQQIMAIASSKERDAFKLVHVPTRTVFSNWYDAPPPLPFPLLLPHSLSLPQPLPLPFSPLLLLCLLYIY